ncbi:polymorphic toxin-type HINT domain-containing protein [Streptomyces youssoufiensis]
MDHIDRRGRRRGKGKTLRRHLALSLSAVLVGTLLQAVSAPPSAADDGTGRPDLPTAERPVAGAAAQQTKPRRVETGPRVPRQAPKAQWAQAGTAVVRIPTVTARTASKPVAAGDLPLRLTPLPPEPTARRMSPPAPASIEARVWDRERAARAGVDGLLFTLAPRATTGGPTRSDSRTGVSVNYSAFAEAYGGDYASRLRLRELPACALTTPNKAECRTSKPLAAVNDTERRSLTAEAVTLRADRATVLAASAEAQGDKGDYKASPLSPSATWNTDLNTGHFGWSYGMPVPEVPGGLQPEVGLSYSSSAIDGRSGGTNNQSSWVGDGFDLGSGFIERRYKPCSEDGVENSDGNKPGDLCWGYDNATITFNGKAGELVPTGDGEWKLQQDDGTRIKRLTSSARDNGDNDNEYWEMTDPDGTVYYFGHHKLPGWATGKETTDSTWTVPVYGDDDGEKCHAAAFKDSWCQQAWRWNLDYVVDPHGNAVAYYYDKETNHYGRNLKAEDETPYVRGGHLDRIEYGLRDGSAYATQALAKVTFTNSERCLPTTGVTCAADTIGTKAQYWYDTPWDLNCAAGAKCDQGRLSPSFWTRKRLTEVTTEVLRGTSYAKVDSWKLGHRWGTADVDYQLLLESVQHTGHTAATPITLPKTTFAYTQLPNRLDKVGDGKAPFNKERVSTVADESGGQIDVGYSAPVCAWDSLPTPQTNTTRCFPQYVAGDSITEPEREWFNKYVVETATSTDRTGGAPDQLIRYSYLDGAAWHFDDDDGLTKEKHKTWSQWRGYGKVRVQTGGQGAGGMKTQEEHYFLRGMDGDRKEPSGGTKSVRVALDAGEGDPITDHASAAGFEYKAVTFTGPGGKVLERSVNRPWHHQTAERKRSWGTITANLTGTAHSRHFTSLDDGAGEKWRTTSTATRYDTVAGRPTEVDDFGDDGTTRDDQCTRTTYADNTKANLFSLTARVEQVSVACAPTPDRSKDVISDVRTAYDGGDYGAAPVRGDATTTATLKEHDGTKATYLESGATYDSYGRALTNTDLTATVTATGTAAPVRAKRDDGRTTTTAYTPTTGLPTKTVVTTPPATKGDASTAQTTTSELDPLRGQPTAQIDTNGKRTSFAQDALGRSTKVWLANRRTTQLPSMEFTYFIEEGQPVAVRTQNLSLAGGSQIASYVLYDGYLRPRQTQSPGPDGGRVLTDTFYDERGLTTKTFAPYYATDNPQKSLFKPADALSVESQTRHTYDGLGRETLAQEIAGNGDGGAVLATTRTVHGGDRTTVIPPEGGTATTTLVDARGKTSELWQHHTRSATAAHDTTRYRYTPSGELAEVTDPAGNTWTFAYDQLGRKVRTGDPDRGVTTHTYDDRGQLTSTTDARDTTLVHDYDGLGRRTGIREGDRTGKLRATWVYDTLSGAKGHLAESTRYVDGAAYTSKVTMRDQLYQPMKTSIVIPEKEGALAGTHQTGTAYHANGLTAGISYSAAGALPGGGASYDYEDGTLRPNKVFDGRGMTATTSYSLTGKPLQYELGGASTGDKKTWVTNTYEWGTQRLATSRVDRQDVPGVDQHATYRYDQIGNVTSVSDTSRSGTDTQCFTYDYLRRLTEAWTEPAKSCQAAPPADGIGGPAPYWLSYTYDVSGNRRTETQHDPAGDTTRNTKRTYIYPAPGSPQPHTLKQVDTQSPTGTARDTYGYDEVGNTRTRTLGGDTQTLTWDAESHLATATEPGPNGTDEVTSYLYDADGNRLISRTPSQTTLHLGHTEITVAKGANTAKATRYLDLGGGHQAVREDDDTISLTVADHHGTGQLAIDGPTFELTQRRTTPFGALRGTEPVSWPGTKGFVGGTIDTSTGLTHLGAREYDPGTGRFISVDPLMDLNDPQQMHGYIYGNNSPLTFSDPTGLSWISDVRDSFARMGKDLLRDSERIARRSWSSFAGGGQVPRGGGYVRTASSGGGGTCYYAMGASYGCGKGGGGRGGGSRSSHSYPVAPEVKTDGALKGFNLFNFVKSLVLPDVEQWKKCSRADAEGCAWAATDLPWGKLFKPLKFFKKAPKSKEQAPPRGRLDCKTDSFLPGTGVLLANGTRKEIEDVRTGDQVTVTDPQTGETTTREVVATIVTEDDKYFTDLTVTTAGATASLIATDHHPFWSPSENAWIDAGDLKPGMTLRTPKGDTVQVQATRHYEKRQRTHNLTVADVHTYYVLAGKTPVLVHNSNCPNWAANSVKTWGHTFKTHGAGAKNTKKLTDRARTTGNQQGQWLDNDAAAEFLKGLHVEGAGPRSVRIPEGVGQVIMPDGSIVKARAATIVPSPNGLYKTGFPIIGPN